MLAQTGIHAKLVRRFAAAAAVVPPTEAASATIENVSRVLVGIALRVIVTPSMEAGGSGGGADAAFVGEYNRCLDALDVFAHPEPVVALLDTGLAAMVGGRS